MRKRTESSKETPSARAPVGVRRGPTGAAIARILTAVLGGAVAAIAWLPQHSPLLVVFGVAAILWATRSTGSPASDWKRVALVSLAGSVAFFAIANRPLVSASGWGGWGTTGEPSIGSTSWWLLNSLWVVLTLWCALFWTAALTLYSRSRVHRAWLRVLLFSTLWVGVAEWTRSVSHWGFEWGFLGLALADVAPLRQWSSVGGILLLSWWLAAASALLVELVAHGERPRWVLPAGTVVAGAIAWFGGAALERGTNPTAPGTAEDPAPVHVAAFQFGPPVPPAGETPLGVSPAWFSTLPPVVERNYDLIVLPESISSHAVQLDGRPAAHLGPNRQVPADAWRRALTPLLPGPERFIALGVEGSVGGTTYNSTTVWGRDGLVGWQHKVHLVPFAEYLPHGWGFLGSQALTYYAPGERYDPIDAGPFRLGGLICQEIQHAGTTRALARSGANLLITGGNDGVFADRRVARLHHSWARIRATEVGRYLVRSMKNGISSVIAPNGEVVGQSPGEDPTLVGAHVTLHSNRTLWTRLGPWPLLAASLGFLIAQAAGSWRARTIDPKEVP